MNLTAIYLSERCEEFHQVLIHADRMPREHEESTSQCLSEGIHTIGLEAMQKIFMYRTTILNVLKG